MSRSKFRSIWASLLRTEVFLLLLILGLVLFLHLVFRRDYTDPGRQLELNIVALGKALISYTEDYEGRFPPSGIRQETQYPSWVNALNQWSQGKEGMDNLTSKLKSPLDKSSSVTSFEMNPAIAGRSLRNISYKDRAHTVLLSEKSYVGSRGYRYYLNGWIARKKESVIEH